MLGVNSRNGQVTLLVIVGIVLLVTVGLVLFLTSNKSSLNKDVQDVVSKDEFKTVDTLTQFCLKQTIKKTQNDILYDNFYYTGPLSPDGLPYYYFSGKDLMRPKEEIEDSYAQKVKPLVLECLANFDSVRPYLGGELVLEDDYLDLSSNMAEEQLTLIANINGELKSDVGAKAIKTISASVPSKVGTFYQGIMLLLYPPIEGNELFYEPAKAYLEEKGITIYGRQAGDGIEMYFLMEEKDLPETQKYRLRISFRFLGSFTQTLSWV